MNEIEDFYENTRTTVKAIVCFFGYMAFLVCLSAQAGDALGRWREGLAGGQLISDSTSPDGELALFEINAYDVGQPTTATAIAVADTKQTHLLGIIDSSTQYATDKPAKDFLTIKWSPDSHYLATQDSTPKHSTLKLYRIKALEFRALPLPDLRQVAADRHHIPEKSINISGQIPVKWLHPDTLLVRVRLSKGRTSRQIDLTISISQDESIAIQPNSQ